MVVGDVAKCFFSNPALLPKVEDKEYLVNAVFFAGDTKPLVAPASMQAAFHVQRKCLFIVTAAEGRLHTRGEEDEQKEQMVNALTKQVRLVEKNYVCKLFLGCGGQGRWSLMVVRHVTKL